MSGLGKDHHQQEGGCFHRSGSTLHSPFPFSEKLHQRIDIRLIGIDGDVVDPAGIEEQVAVPEVLLGRFFNLQPKTRA
jgi:hypothetical protein